MSAGPSAVFANLLASLGGPRWAGPRWAVAARLSGRRSVNRVATCARRRASSRTSTAGIPFAQPDDEDEWMSYVDLGDIEASWPSGTSWPSSSGDV